LTLIATLQEWAAEEAEVRLQRLEEGKPVEYGKFYHKQTGQGGFKVQSVAELDGPATEVEEEEEEE
jgi:hypothetical protein